uniref:Uncharacterized protein n=1 Tax=Octopus bimaculoides TaxID=37653 RepID=A0A0L8HJQ7_OCTBM
MSCFSFSFASGKSFSVMLYLYSIFVFFLLLSSVDCLLISLRIDKSFLFF